MAGSLSMGLLRMAVGRMPVVVMRAAVANLRDSMVGGFWGGVCGGYGFVGV